MRPYVDYWLVAYISSSVFANRDFAELLDGEVRLTHPLNSHLAHTAMLWRKACEPVAAWLVQAFDRAAGAGPALALDDHAPLAGMWSGGIAAKPAGIAGAGSAAAELFRSAA